MAVLEPLLSTIGTLGVLRYCARVCTVVLEPLPTGFGISVLEVSAGRGQADTVGCGLAVEAVKTFKPAVYVVLVTWRKRTSVQGSPLGLLTV